MADISDEDIKILAAKVVALEILMRELFRDTLLRVEDPIKALDTIISRASKPLENEIAKSGINDPSFELVTVSEQINNFRDRLHREILKARNPRS